LFTVPILSKDERGKVKRERGGRGRKGRERNEKKGESYDYSHF